MLRVAIQKSGRLSEDSLQLIKNCGISYPKMKARLKTEAYNFPMELLYLRDDDIPQYVADGVADIGIVGENELLEKDKDVDLIEHLGFSKCRLSIAVPRDMDFQSLEQLNGSSIATSYPVILKNFLREKEIKCQIHEISGSVEIAPSIGLAGAICDLVSTGSTLLSNGLKEVATVMRSEAVLVANPNLSEEKKSLMDKLLFRIQTVNRAKQYKYVLLNAPNNRLQDIIDVLPGMKSPTVLPLAVDGWSSVHSVVQENQFWEIIDELRDMGAEGILIVPIEKMIL
ncbi:MAG: ATP phosphoribosyltransferase [Bacteroidota bacterium]